MKRTGTVIRLFARAPASRELAITEGGRKVVSAAAWLVWEHRAQLRRAGSVDFTLPRGAELPNWMAAALQCLDLRPRTWAVVRMVAPGGGKRWRLRWKRWSGHSRRRRP